METVLTGEPIPKVDPILVLELVLEMDPIPQIPIPAQNTVIPCPILIPTKNGIKTSLVLMLVFGRYVLGWSRPGIIMWQI